jgi:hypothetical protein
MPATTTNTGGIMNELAQLEDQARVIFTTIFEDDQTQIRNINSIKMFVRKLGFDQAFDAALYATSKIRSPYGSFKYFCGICHNKLKSEGGVEK